MQRWTPQHARFVGRVIFANFLNLPLENYESIIEEAESLSIFKQLSRTGSGRKRNRPAIIVRRLSRARTLEEKENASVAVVAKPDVATKGEVVARIERNGNKSTIRYACEGFNKMYVIESALRDELCADGNIRSMLFRLRRISSRNALTHSILRGIIEHQGKFLRTGNPIDLVPLSQRELTAWINKSSHTETRYASRFTPVRRSLGEGGRYDNSWLSRLVNGLSVIIPSGEEKPLRWFFQTEKDVNKRLIKQLLDNENQDLESGTLERPLTDDQIRVNLETKYGVRRSRHSIAHCRKDMGIPPAKRRLSGYKYPPLSANFSMLYPLTIEPVQSNTPAGPGIYEFRLKGQEIEYPKGKTKVIYIGSAKNLNKRIKEHLRANNKNGHIRDFLRKFDCSFRYVEFSKNWREEEARLYNLFVATYGASPRCNRVSPVGSPPRTFRLLQGAVL